MKKQVYLFAALLITLAAAPSTASETLWSCTVAEIADGGSFEAMNHFSFKDYPEVSVLFSEEGHSASIGAVSFGGDSATAVSEIATGNNVQTFAAYSDYNEDEFTPIVYIEIFNPSAKKTIGTVRYRDLETDEISLLGSFHCQRSFLSE